MVWRYKVLCISICINISSFISVEFNVPECFLVCPKSFITDLAIWILVGTNQRDQQQSSLFDRWK